MLFIGSATPDALASSLAPLVVARLGLGAGRCVSESAERAPRGPRQRLPRYPRPRDRGEPGGRRGGHRPGRAARRPLSEAYGPRACFPAVTGAALVTALLAAAETATAARAEDDDGVDWLLLLKDGRWRGLTAAEVCSRFGFAAKIASVPWWRRACCRRGGRRRRARVARGPRRPRRGAGGRLWRRPRRRAGHGCGLGPRRRRRAGAAPRLSMEDPGVPFSALIICGPPPAAQAPALQALAQRLAPPGGEAEALALPRAAGALRLTSSSLMCLGSSSTRARRWGAAHRLAGVAGVLGAVAVFVALPSPSRAEEQNSHVTACVAKVSSVVLRLRLVTSRPPRPSLLVSYWR